MAGNNDCVMADLNGKRAAVELANVRPENFTALCYSIDNNLKDTSAQYQATFMRSMNQQLEEHNLLPRVELNMVQQTDNDVLQKLQDRKKHIDTKDLVQAEDQFKDQGRNVESNLVHGLITHEKDIHDTHAERNFWGKNHGGINMDRINRWSNQNRPDMYGALNDLQDAQRDTAAANRKESAVPFPETSRKESPIPRPETESMARPEAPAPSPYDRKQDSRIQALEKDEHERDLRAKLKAGVEKDAHVTVHKGDTLEDMARIALHKAGVTHMTDKMIDREAEKIRLVNKLERGEHLKPGVSLMLRTEAEVNRETERRFTSYEKSHSHHAMLSGFSITESHSTNQKQAVYERGQTSYYSVDGSSDDEDVRVRRPVRRHTPGY